MVNRKLSRGGECAKIHTVLSTVASEEQETNVL